MRLIYLTGARLPNPMAHGVQITQNCEAFAAAGHDVRLWYARRGSSAGNDALYTFYGVPKTFKARKLPCLNLHPWADLRLPAPFVALAFNIMLATFGIAAAIGARFARPDVVYGRDPLTLWLVSMLYPRAKMVWEAHSFKTSGRGRWIQRQTLKRAFLTVAITPPLRDDLHALEPAANVLVAHDGIRRARFESLPTRDEARAAVKWPREAFVIGYMGRLTTYGMSKGVDLIIASISQLSPDLRARAALGLVGGPDDEAEQYRQAWVRAGLDPARFLYAGQVSSDDVPRWLAAFDACVLPLPKQSHFVYYTSPLKLFEYMASRRPLIASNLPSWADVLTDGRNALLFEPESVSALTAALIHVMTDVALRTRLADNAHRDVFARHTWDKRAEQILGRLA